MEKVVVTKVVSDKLRVQHLCGMRRGRGTSSPTAALEEALRRTEDRAGRAPSSAAGGLHILPQVEAKRERRHCQFRVS